jgi:hypothetical protein
MAVIARLSPIIRGWATLSERGVVQVVHRLGRLLVVTALQVGHTKPREKAEVLDRQPVLRQVQQVQERPLGLRGPQQRRLPGQVRLD